MKRYKKIAHSVKVSCLLILAASFNFSFAHGCFDSNNDSLLFKNMQANYIENVVLKSSASTLNKAELTAEQKRDVMDNFKNQPVKFIENKGQMVNTSGQAVPFVLFKAEAGAMNVYITEQGLTYVFVKNEEEEHEKDRKDALKDEKVKTELAWVNVVLKNGNIKRENIITEGKNMEHNNYFLAHCPQGIYDVYKYEKVTIKNVYPNIDWVFYNSDKFGMKYDFIVHPGADANNIKLIYQSKNGLKIDDKGDISIKTKLGTLTENAPYSYINEINEMVESGFYKEVIDKSNVEVGYNLARKNKVSETLIIDPQLVWGTFYGSSIDIEGIQDIGCDGAGNLFVTGYTQSSNFPTLNPGGAYFQVYNGALDAFNLKFSSNGNLIWSTFYGGTGNDSGRSIVVDLTGNVFVTGYSVSTNFPLLNPGGGAYFQPFGGVDDMFVLKFTNAGSLLWATYYGGSGSDSGQSIEVDLTGNVFIVGVTSSTNIPLANPGGGCYFQPLIGNTSLFNDLFILKFSNTGVLIWATYYGGNKDESLPSICKDLSGNIFITGGTDSNIFPTLNPLGGAYFQGVIGGFDDAFILKFSNTGILLWATYYGGSFYDYGFSIAADLLGNIVVAGQTKSINLPVFNPGGGAFMQPAISGPGVRNTFILKFTNAGVRTWATYYGGPGDNGNGTVSNLSFDSCGNFYLSFYTMDVWPYLQNTSCPGYFNNLFYSINNVLNRIILSKFSNTNTLLYCTYVGGNGGVYREVTYVDSNNNLFLAGEWPQVAVNSTYPLANPGGGAYYDPTFNGGGDDAFLMKFTPTPPTYQQSQTNPSACNCNGVATVSVICGEAPYSYQWSNSVSVLNSTLTTHSI
jgi:hypothetical protein